MIFIFTHNKQFINTMNLLWGVTAIYYNRSESTDATMQDLEDILKANGYVEEGDVIDCPALRGQVADLDYSRFNSTDPFDWPVIEDCPANVVPEQDGTCDFFYLYDLKTGGIGWRRPSSGLGFAYRFDRDVLA